MIVKQLKDTTKLSYQEQNIAKYILENPECILNATAKELAVSIYTNPSTIIRFCQKLGFKGYPDFQIQYIKEYITTQHYKPKQNLHDLLTNEYPDYTDHFYNHIIKETKQMISSESLNRIINHLMKAKKVDLFGNDINYYHLQSMSLRFNAVNIHAQAFNALNYNYLNSIQPNETVSIVVSHSGNNQALLKIAQQLKQRGVITIALTNKTIHDLDNLCDESMYIYYSDDVTHIAAHTISLEYLLNLIYISVLAKGKIPI